MNTIVDLNVKYIENAWKKIYKKTFEKKNTH